MRIQSRHPALAPRIAQRELERSDAVIEVLAPEGWTDAQVEAWLDWADGPFDDEAPLGGGPARYVDRIAKAGLSDGLFADAADADAFREALLVTMLTGVASPASAPAAAQRLPDIGEIEFKGAAEVHLSRWRSARLAAKAAARLDAALALVGDAVQRCHGDAKACADPAKNSALGRAARRARELGADDRMILDAIALAGAPRTALVDPDVQTLAPLVASASRQGVAAVDEAASFAAQVGWESSALILALSPEDAEALTRGAPVRAAINVAAFQHGEAFDSASFNQVVGLWATALEIERGERPAEIGLAGVGDWLLTQGLSVAGDAGRDAASALWALAVGAALSASAEAAAMALEEFERGAWGQKYPTVTASWRRAWDRVIPFFAFPPAVRRVVYTTNAIESIHSQLRKIIKTRGHFPSDDAATKLIWLALRNITADWGRAAKEWREAMNQFAILYEERFTLPAHGGR